MATTNMKRIAANALAQYLSDRIPGLTGRTSAVAADPNEDLDCLAVKVIPDHFSFHASEPDEVYWNEGSDDGKVVIDVGQWVGNFVVELYTSSPAERERYEQAILDLFLETEWAPGTVFLASPNLTVGDYASLHSAEIKFRLDSENWIDNMAYEGRRYSFIDVSVDYPALVARNAATIESLQLALASTDDEIATIEDVEDSLVKIQGDGQTSKLP